MKDKRFFLKKLGILMILLCLCLAVLPGNVDAKAKAKTKTVKIHKFSSGDKKVDKKVRSVIKKYIKPKMTTAERVKTIHDYIVLNCKYDHKNYLKGKIPAASYTAKGVLLKKKAVCAGYADAFQLFMDALGIPCATITGSANNGSGSWNGHAWNRVKINKKWYNIDVTWADPVPDRKGYINYDYFLITDKKLMEDHFWFGVKKCKASNNKFITLFGKVSKTMDSAVDDLYTGYKKDKNGEAQIIVHKKLYKAYDDFHAELLQRIESKYQERFVLYCCGSDTYADYYIITINVDQAEKVENKDDVVAESPASVQ